MDFLNISAIFVGIVRNVVALAKEIRSFFSGAKREQSESPSASPESSQDPSLGRGPVVDASTSVKSVFGITHIGSITHVHHHADAIGPATTDDHRYSSETPSEPKEKFDTGTINAHSLVAREELHHVLAIRGLDWGTASKNIQSLARRIQASGDLSAVEPDLRKEVLHWSARICAVDQSSFNFAEKCLSELLELEPSADVDAVKALLQLQNNNTDAALRLLRDASDPESKSTMFMVIRRSRNCEAALDWWRDFESEGEDFFTPIGWHNWAVCMAQVERWEEAASRLRGFDRGWHSEPALALIEATINAALLLPTECRAIALEAIPLFRGVSPVVGPIAEKYHARATECFDYAIEHASQCLENEITQRLEDWRMWLKLMSPHSTDLEAAQSEVVQGMLDGPKAVRYVLFAWAFGIEYDHKPLYNFLRQRRSLGGLTEREQQAEFLVAERSMTPSERIEYLQTEEATLLESIRSEAVLAAMFQALLEDGNLSEANDLLERSKEHLESTVAARLEAEIALRGDESYAQTLEEMYANTNSLIDLQNLVSHLHSIKDYDSLLPRATELFSLHRTLSNARLVAESFEQCSLCDYSSLLEFLETNDDITARDLDLKALKALALYNLGRPGEAKVLIDDIGNERSPENDLYLELRVLSALGDWSGMVSVVAREWNRKDSHNAKTLVAMAQIAATSKEESTRALDFARLAVDKAPEDPHVLAAAYFLFYQLGAEESANPEWIERAHDLSSDESGPVWAGSVEELLSDIVPERQRVLEKAEKEWLRGDIPHSTAAKLLGIPLARFLLIVPSANEREPDGRKRVVLHTTSGARDLVEMDSEWTVALDLSSILVLASVNMLETAMSAFEGIRLAPDIMGALLLERTEAKFHQPTRVRDAEQLRQLVDTKRIRLAKDRETGLELVNRNIGAALASLLEHSKSESGSTVCVLPILTDTDSTVELLITETYGQVIVSVSELCDALYQRGIIDSENLKRARLFLRGRDKPTERSVPIQILDAPIFLDGLAITYLQYLKLLPFAASAGLDIRIHRTEYETAAAFIEVAGEGEQVIEKIEQIRNILRKAIESRTATFLPRSTRNEGDAIQLNFHLFQMASLLAAHENYDACCVDDPFINRLSEIASTEGRKVPIVTVSDILLHLKSSKTIESDDLWALRHRLRQKGHFVVPVDSDELMQWLRVAETLNGELHENAELRLLRQTISRIELLCANNPVESLTALNQVLAKGARLIPIFWEDEDGWPADNARAASDWIWRNLLEPCYLARRHLAKDASTNLIKEGFARLLACLFLPLHFSDSTRLHAYTQWLGVSVIGTFAPANPDIIEQALEFVIDQRNRVEMDPALFDRLVLLQLPDSTRDKLASLYPSFAFRAGLRFAHKFHLDSNLMVESSVIFSAASSLFESSDQKFALTVDGTEITLTIEEPKREIVLRWRAEDEVRERKWPELMLFSPEAAERCAALKDIVSYVGPTGDQFEDLLNVIESGKLNEFELFNLYREIANSVPTAHARLRDKVQLGEALQTRDLVPRSFEYYEQFCGPLPDDRTVDDYIENTLIGHRKSLLSRDLVRGLEICCFGALREDLMPGRWIFDLDKDFVWDALSSIQADNSPFSVLGVLDVALYFQEDQRFVKLANDAIDYLVSECMNDEEPRTHRLFSAAAELVSNHVALLSGGANVPNYWRRMCGWMQAGLISQILVSGEHGVNVEEFEREASGNIVPVGDYAMLVGARVEPLFGSRAPRSLRYQILRLLLAIREHHEKEGRILPGGQLIDQAFQSVRTRSNAIAFYYPGPLHKHEPPTELAPEDILRPPNDLQEGQIERFPWPGLAALSQFLKLGDQLLELAREQVRCIEGPEDHEGWRSSFQALEAAAAVAAASRDRPLAEEIAQRVRTLASRASDASDFHQVVRTLLHAAAAIADHGEWSAWLEQSLQDLARSLPSHPSNSLKHFRRELDGLSVVLPIDLLPYASARSESLVGTLQSL